MVALQQAGLTGPQVCALLELRRGLEFTRDRVGQPGCPRRIEATEQLGALDALAAIAIDAIARKAS